MRVERAGQLAQKARCEMKTIFTVEQDEVTRMYRAKWCLPEDFEAQWFHERSLTGPLSVDAAKQDVLHVKPDAVYMPPAQFEEEIAVVKLALENGW